MKSPSETSPLVENPLPVVLKKFTYNFADKRALECSGVHDRSTFWLLNLGLLSCYVVCGLIIAALSKKAFCITYRL